MKSEIHYPGQSHKGNDFAVTFITYIAFVTFSPGFRGFQCLLKK